MIDKDTHLALRAKYNPEGSPLRTAQLDMLELLSFVDRICKEHNLTYWLDSGSLLGAMRHGGFIPWDDDTDVCMPVKDARKLRKIMADKVFDGHIVLQTGTTDPCYLNAGWTTLRDLNTEYIQDNIAHMHLKYRGLQTDIFEVETDPGRFGKRIPQLFDRYFVRGLTHRHPTSMTMLRIATLFAKVMRGIVVPLCRLGKRNKDVYDYAVGSPFTQKQQTHHIFPLTTVTFEGREFMAPNNPDSYLTAMYGDWRRVPSQEEIVTHDVTFRRVNR